MPVRVSKRELSRLKRRGRPVKIRLPATSDSKLVTVPPSGDAAQTALSIPDAKPMPDAGTLVPTSGERAPKWKLPPNSKVKKTAMKILALRLRGIPDEDIAKAVGLANAMTVRGYMYRAGKNGWLTDEVTSPKDVLDFDIMHKVVRNMSQALDSEDDARRDKMAVKIAEGTIFKQYDQDPSAAKPAMTMLAVQVVMPEDGFMPTLREGAAVGVGNILDAEVVK